MSGMTERSIMDQKEEKIRRNWLLITIFYFLVFPLGSFVLSGSLLLSKDQMYEAVRYVWSGFVIFGFIFLSIFCYCAYKKHGTRLLTYCVVSIPYQLFSFFLTISMCNLFLKDVFLLLISYSIMYILWYKSNLRLIKINKKLQIWKTQNEMKYYPEYLQSLENLKETLSIEDLNDLFYKTIRTWPRFEEFTSMQYRLLRSRIFEQNS